ncbi:unnamed protein product [Hydatigera taeniaeformis]|uniref:Ephrin RBD domain-containing protein n=1 Tax=Hydatigena taeniaeformis TaxID=6205 RepID=A0A0R3WVT0_HYDTA|nr:unnamed protein product [Hydatigera taeniaeformis]
MLQEKACASASPVCGGMKYLYCVPTSAGAKFHQLLQLTGPDGAHPDTCMIVVKDDPCSNSRIPQVDKGEGNRTLQHNTPLHTTPHTARSPLLTSCRLYFSAKSPLRPNPPLARPREQNRMESGLLPCDGNSSPETCSQLYLSEQKCGGLCLTPSAPASVVGFAMCHMCHKSVYFK